MSNWIATLRRQGLAVRSAALGLAVLAVYALAAPAAGCISGVSGLAAAATAAVLCWLGAELALRASSALLSANRLMYGVLVGMLLRMGVPLISALALQLTIRPLAEAYLLVYFLVFYPVALLVETVLSLPLAEMAGACNDASSSAVR